AGMAGSWTGAAAAAAGAEAAGLATITGDKGSRVAEGATAFTDYGTALATARAAVATLRRQADQADQDARSEANRTGQGLPYEDRRAIYESLRGQALVPLRQRHRAVLETLDRAAATAAGRLTAAVPEYSAGMSPAAVAVAVRRSVAARLPALEQLDGTTRGRELAAELGPLLERGQRIPDALLARLEADAGNPWFAKTLLETLGPRAPHWSMLVMNANGFPKDHNERVITGFARLLALGTRTEGPAALSDAYVRDLLAPLDQHDGLGVQYAWHLGHLLHFGGRFGTDFLTRAGDRLHALDRAGHDGQLYTMVGGILNRPLTHDRVPDDAMQAYFTSVARDAAAARAFFHGHPERLAHHLLDRRTDDYLGDRGESLGAAIAAATRVHDDGTAGRESAEVTADLVRTLGGKEHDFLVEHDREKVLPHLATVLNGYSADVFYALSRTDYGGAAGTGARPGQPELGTKEWGVDFAAADLRGVLAQLDHDTEAYKSVVAAQLSASELFLRDKLAAAREDPPRRDQLLQSYARGHGLVLNQLFSTHIDTQVAMGKLDDFDRTHDLRVADAVSGTLLTIMPLYPPLAIPATVLSMGKGATMPFLYEGLATSASADAARSESVREVDRWYSATLGNMVVTMQDGGGFAGTPAEADSWQSAHGVGAADRFTGPGGRVLEPAAMTEGQRAAYQRWLSDPENEAVRVEMVRVFTALDAAGGGRGG
ncbi:MAG: hypothetical protein AVDCRST_MAG41-2544, partial [uncultured Corynebacteriales bacterium]